MDQWVAAKESRTRIGQALTLARTGETCLAGILHIVILHIVILHIVILHIVVLHIVTDQEFERLSDLLVRGMHVAREQEDVANLCVFMNMLNTFHRASGAADDDGTTKQPMSAHPPVRQSFIWRDDDFWAAVLTQAVNNEKEKTITMFGASCWEDVAAILGEEDARTMLENISFGAVSMMVLQMVLFGRPVAEIRSFAKQQQEAGLIQHDEQMAHLVTIMNCGARDVEEEFNAVSLQDTATKTKRKGRLALSLHHLVFNEAREKDPSVISIPLERLCDQIRAAGGGAIMFCPCGFILSDA
eukprot:SAG31_NODE_7340_length_1715_cov_1.270421_1_plen_300_part_00